MLVRIISGAVGLVLFLAVMFMGNLALSIGVFLLSSIAVYELCGVCGYNKYKIFPITGVITSGLFVFGNGLKSVYFMAYLIFLLMVFVFIMLIKHDEISSKDIFAVFLPSVLIAFAFSSICNIKRGENGSIYVWVPFIAAWVTDTFAYFSGRFFGKHKLIEKISPKKTIEGSIGGILGAVIGFLIFFVVIGNKFNMEFNILYVVILAVTSSVISQVGDLFASAIKRENQIKDFGNLMPGHGGVMDRFDSLILTVPYIYIFLQIFPII